MGRDNVVLNKAVKRNHRLADWLVASVMALMTAIGACATLGVLYFQRGQMLNNGYNKSLYEVSDNIDNIEVRLSKLAVSNDDFESALLANEIWRQSDNAASNLAQLPLEHNSIGKTTKFVNQLGEYTYSLGKKLSGGGKLTEDEKQTVEGLHAACRGIKSGIDDLTAKVNDGYNIMRHMNPNKKQANFKSGFDDMEKNSVDYPKMIYDGPFSDSTESRDFKAVKELEEITPEQAGDKIRDRLSFAGIQSVDYLGEAGGDLLTYEFEVKADGGGMYVQITKQGGYFLMINRNSDVRQSKLSDEQAVAAAERIAAELGYVGMSGVWYNEIGNIAYVNLAFSEGGIIIYPDLVKVKISLDDGMLMGVEAQAYCCNHTGARGLKSTISENTARSMLSYKLEVGNVRLAVIPKGQKEVLCYEFACSYKDMDYFVYIDAGDGKQVDVQRVVDSAQGKQLS